MYYCKSRYYVPEWGRFLTPDSFEYLDPSSINGVNLYAYCNNDPVNNIDPNGNAWYHILAWTLAIITLIAAGLAVMIASGGSAMVALTGVMSASLGVTSSSMGLTIASYMFVGATLGFVGTSMWASRTGNMEEAGLGVLLSTVTGGLYGAYGGYLSYKIQIGDPSNCGPMSKYDRQKQRRDALKEKEISIENAKNLQISHPYGTYGNNRYYYDVVTVEEHKQFHKIYGYKTYGGQFIRKNPSFQNLWEWFKWLL